MDAAVRCMLDTVQRFNEKLPPRPLNYNNANVKVSLLVCNKVFSTNFIYTG